MEVKIPFEFLNIASISEGVINIELNRAPVNAVHRSMYIEIAEAFRSIDDVAAGARCVVLSGKGPHFCAGNDLDEFATMTPENGTERMWRVREAFFAISDSKVPVIGVIHGSALGTGLAVAASCDFIVAEPNARLGLPEMTVGVMGGARHLARIAPAPLVRRMFFTGQPLSASELFAAGGSLVVSEPGKAFDHALTVAQRIATYSPTALRRAKVILDRIEFMDLKPGYEFEQAGTVQMSGHPDSKEALAAFREKRAPSYQPLSLPSPP